MLCVIGIQIWITVLEVDAFYERFMPVPISSYPAPYIHASFIWLEGEGSEGMKPFPSLFLPYSLSFSFHLSSSLERLPTSRQHESQNDHLEERKKLSEMLCIHWVWQLYSKCIHLYKQFLQAVNDWALSHWDSSTVIRCVCMHSFLLLFILCIMCCVTVTCWCGPGGIEAWSGRPSSSFSAVTLLVGCYTCKNCSYEPRDWLWWCPWNDL